MIFGKTQKIMKTGISKYSKELGLSKEKTQILVQSKETEKVTYKICDDWSPKMNVSFKDIMDVKVDLLGFEKLSSPFLIKSVEMYSKIHKSPIDEINLFLFEKNKKIGLAVYVNNKYKEMLTLEKQFERLGLG